MTELPNEMTLQMKRFRQIYLILHIIIINLIKGKYCTQFSLIMRPCPWRISSGIRNKAWMNWKITHSPAEKPKTSPYFPLLPHPAIFSAVFPSPMFN